MLAQIPLFVNDIADRGTPMRSCVSLIFPITILRGGKSAVDS